MQGAVDDPGAAARARIEVTENLGWETILHASIEAGASTPSPAWLTIRVESARAPRTERPGPVYGVHHEGSEAKQARNFAKSLGKRLNGSAVFGVMRAA
jgi:hypothetical protein